MAVNDQSVATDLAALLRESLNDEIELTAKMASIPVQLATAPVGFTPPGAPVRPSYASVHPNGPPSGIRPANGGNYEASEPLQLASQPLTMPTPLASMMPAMPTPLSMRSSVPVARQRSNVGLIVGAFLGVALLAGAAGGGFAWYRAKHVALPPAPVAVAAPVATVAAPVATVAAPVATVAVATPVVEPPAPVAQAAEALPAPPATTTADEAPAPVATHHHSATAMAPAAPKPDPVAAAQTPPPAPAPKPVVAATPAPAPKPAAPPPAAPKPAAGGVDALLQQQLSGAIP